VTAREIEARRQSQPLWRRPTVACAALLSLAVWATFGPTIANDLTFDDLDTIKNNSLITSLGNLRLLFSKSYFDLSDEFTYRPIVTLSYFLDHALAGKSAWIYHLHNVVLHHVNVLLLFVLFNLLGAGWARSFAVALVFALHPLHTEAVIFPGFREDLQMTAGSLAMACCLAADRKRPGIALPLIAALSLVLGLFAKEGALFVPVAWLLGDLLGRRQGESFRRLCGRYIPPAIVLGLYVAVRFVIMANPQAAEMDVVDYLPMRQRFLTAPYLFAYYVRRFLWPTPLCIVPEVESLSNAGTVFFESLVVVGAVVALWIVVMRRQRWVLPAGLWIAATFAPVSNIYPIVNLWAERFYYVVGVGTSAIAVAAAGTLWEWFAGQLELRSGNFARKSFVSVGWALVGLLACAAAVTDVGRILECRTSLSLWRATVRCAPTNKTALSSLAIYELEAGNFVQAEMFAREAELRGDWPYRVNYILATSAFRQGKWDRAIEYLEKALAVPSPSPTSRAALARMLATAYLKTDRRDLARKTLEWALEWNPQDEDAQKLLQQVETKHDNGVSTEKG